MNWTQHRQFPQVEYTKYESTIRYSIQPTYSQLGMGLIHNFTHILFNSYYDRDGDAPDDFIIALDNTSTFTLGPKVEANVWQALLVRNNVVLWWVILLLIIIAVVPLIGCIYFCFCCYRCPKTCPPCDRGLNVGKRIFYSILLMLLIVGILLGFIIAFVNEKLIDSRLRDSTEVLQRGRKDTCAFVKDVCDHVNHVYVNNFEELQSHLTPILMDSAVHITDDLRSASGLYVIEKLIEILDNIPEALRLMQNVEKLQFSLVFMGSQYRDSLRGAKRNFAYLFTVFCDFLECNDLMRNSFMMLVDNSKCLHYDNLPNTTDFVSIMKDIIKEQYHWVPRKWEKRFEDVEQKLKDAITPVIPPIVQRLNIISQVLKVESENICNISGEAISSVYFKNLRMQQHFEELYDNYGSSRRYVSFIVYMSIISIVITLICALVCGLGLRKDNSGSECLILAIILIFVFLSFIMLIGLFYFMLGLALFPTCILQDDQGKNILFRLLKTVLNGTDIMEEDMDPSLNQTSNEITPCQPSQFILEMLRENQLYDIDRLKQIYADTKLPDIGQMGSIEKAVKNSKMLDPMELHSLYLMRNEYLGIFNSKVFTKNLCTQLTGVQSVVQSTHYLYQGGMAFFARDPGDYLEQRFRVASENVRKISSDMYNYHSMEFRINHSIVKIREHVREIDNLITLNDLNFNETIETIINSLVKAENFIHLFGTLFVKQMVDNLTLSTQRQIDDYLDAAIRESKEKIGPCRHLAYTYEQKTDDICYQLVNPINGIWLGLLICALLFLPVLFVAHQLICLYRVFAHAGAGIVYAPDVNSCPTCTGAPYIPPAVVICTNTTTNWTLEDYGRNKPKGD